jgi:hypothetical protein
MEKKDKEPEIEKDSLGQPNPAWALEKKNMAEAEERGKEAAKEAKKEAK